MNNPLVIVTDGVISAGKSLYINTMASLMTKRGWKVTIVKENIDEWNTEEIPGEPSMFQKFNDDKKRWGYHFQTKVFFDRVMENKRMFEKYGENTQIFILERFCSTDRLFMEALHEGGYVDKMEMKHYNEWACMWEELLPYEPDLFIYLDVPVEVAMQRLGMRNRPGEEGITAEYQQILKEKHDKFFENDFVQISKDSHLIPRIKISATQNFKDDEKIKEAMADQFEEIVRWIQSARKVVQ